MIQEAIRIVSEGKNLTSEEMSAVMRQIMTGAIETPLIVDFLIAFNKKGETIEELTAAVSVMRSFVTRIKTNRKPVLDTCGTGGDRKGTFNISTTVAFVASGCGIAVAKHGNRSVSSCCGSADILEALGVNINREPKNLEDCLNGAGIAFLFAPNLHPAMKYAMPARKQIGTKTIFNILGPLTNPAGATHQLIGVYDSRWTPIMAQVLANLGSVHAMVVHGEDGLDEITATTETSISEVHQGRVKNYQMTAQELGIKGARLEDLAGGDAACNARILLDVLKGKHGPQRDIVVLNAAAAVYVADKTPSIKEGIALAQESIDSGKALEKLELLRQMSKK